MLAFSSHDVNLYEMKYKYTFTMYCEVLFNLPKMSLSIAFHYAEEINKTKNPIVVQICSFIEDHVIFCEIILA